MGYIWSQTVRSTPESVLPLVPRDHTMHVCGQWRDKDAFFLKTALRKPYQTSSACWAAFKHTISPQQITSNMPKFDYLFQYTKKRKIQSTLVERQWLVTFAPPCIVNAKQCVKPHVQATYSAFPLNISDKTSCNVLTDTRHLYLYIIVACLTWII
jgi:hypothetical protein